jgi:hypothetical protein
MYFAAATFGTAYRLLIYNDQFVSDRFDEGEPGLARYEQARSFEELHA